MENNYISQLDIRFNGKLDPDTSILFNQVSNDKRGDFNDFVSVISEANINNVDWWVEGPASRNTVSSPLFHNYCSFFLVKNLIEQDRFNFKEILVDSKEIAYLIKQVFENYAIKNVGIVLSGSNDPYYKKILKHIFLIPVLFFRISMRFLIAKLTRSFSETSLPNEPLVLIDTFMLPAYTDSDRWYGSLWKNVPEKQIETLFFVPTIVITKIHELYGVFKRLRKNERNFLIKEDFLKTNDIFFAFGIRKRMKKIQIPELRIDEYDFTPILKSELYNNRDLLTVIEALLLFRFIERLKQNSVKVRLSIDWFEGQAMDKAWSLGFKTFFPESKQIGFRAFESYPFYLCSYPVPTERKAGVIPGIFAVQGKGTIPTVREFLHDVEVIVVPSFRSEHVWQTPELYESKTKQASNEFTILVTLPIKPQTASQILKQLMNVSGKVNVDENKIVKYILKLHPACPINDEFKDLLRMMPYNFVLTEEKSFPALIKKTDLLVSEASSTCLEALACGIAVIVVQNEEGLTYNPIPSSIPPHLYISVSSGEQLIFALQKYIQRTDSQKEEQWKQGKWVRENYFEKVTPQGVNTLLDI